jgi:hypothetical protein
MNNIDNFIVLDKYINIVLNTYFNNNVIKSNGYNFRCNICGDSKHSSKKRRGWILKDKTPWMYYCHNCGSTLTVSKWLKNYFPDVYRGYIKEKLVYRNISKTINTLNIPKNTKPVKKEYKNIPKEFISITSDSIYAKKAVELCCKRNIPKHIWQTWYVAIDGEYVNRMIIPFFDNDLRLYYFQARSLNSKTDNKYINMPTNRDNAIYNYYNINRNLPVIITEGVIDSLFIENSISVLSTKWPDEVQVKINQLKSYFLLDNDNDGKQKMNKLLYNKHNVFMWKKFMKHYNIPYQKKWDINDICLYLKKDGFTFNELKIFFTNSIVQGMWI